MSNLIKSFYAGVDNGKKVIDSNQLVAERVERQIKGVNPRPANDNRVYDEDGFSEGLDAENIDLILADGEEMQEQQAEEEPAPSLEEINEEAQRILEEARMEAEQVLNDAAQAAEANKEAVFAEARSAGYDEGYAAGMSEVEAMKQELNDKAAQLEAEYNENIEKLEPMFIDTLTDIYEHIFNVSLSDNKEIIYYLIRNALSGIDSDTGMIIHVSKDDYGFVSMQKKELLSGIYGGDNIEIVEDMTLQPNEAFIETGGGIFDCSLETQLKGLKRQLRLLSYEGKDASEGE